ncbi:protein vav isoform X7 [Rhopalosiphum maidis]|uniref:protein vav isoform X7 n=1 Tax=Rhopalosiphum maidis TaxID=43146 RepID=UPI000F01034E|nr:protein vav isoform X7 [Rhopalosiphum maidis]
MYVIFPADEVVQLSFGRPTTRQRQQQRSGQRCYCNQHRTVPVVDGGNKFLRRDQPMNSMASAMGDDLSLRDLTHPALNESLKTHNAATFKLVKTVSDFTQELSQMYEQHAAELQLLVTNFRKKNTDLRKDRPSFPSQLFYTWETFLQEVETDSKSISDVANVLGRQISRPLLDRSFHRKVQSRKVFSQRDSLELILQKSEDKLSKCREDYKRSFLAQLSSPNSSASLSLYLDAHNAYVTQLHATNGMFDQYNQYVLPQLLQELEDVYSDLCMSLSDAVLQGSDVIYNKSSDQSKRYNALGSQCRQLTPGSDLTAFARSLTPLPTTPHLLQRTRNYCPPQAPTDTEGLILEPGVTEAIAQLALKNELIVDRLASLDVRAGYDTIRAELMDLESQMKQIQDSVETFKRLQQRSLEQSMFTKANELQEDISIKKFEFRTAQMHLAAVKSQKDLFASKLETTESNARDRKLSSSSSGSMKSKWLKAIKSLKTTSGPTNNNTTQKDEKKHQMYHAVSTIIAMRKTGRDGNPQFSANTETAHQFQEYTYKKITPCDFCSQVLRGHTRQGLKCRVCKMNVHLDCQEKVTTRCQVKSRLLRRQKSTSEIETKMAAMNVTGRDDDETPHSPRRPKLNSRMKSFSLDSSDTAEQAQRRRMGGSCTGSGGGGSGSSTGLQQQMESYSNPSSSSRLQSPSSPVHNRRLLSTRTIRMSSVELPDDNDKSLSSASTSPCPSPVRYSQKPHRLLPNNLYVVLYNFKARREDELDLKAGYKVTVIDTSDPAWWKGKCFGRVGYFPYNYVTKVQPGERPWQVTINLQVLDVDNNPLTLLRDQIVIQIGEGPDGSVMIRNAENKQGMCPVKFLQEV